MNLMFWKKKPVDAQEDETADAPVAKQAKAHEAPASEDVPEPGARNRKLYLVLGGGAVLLVVSLVLIGLAVKKMVSPAEEPDAAVPAEVQAKPPVLPNLQGGKNLINLPPIEVQKIDAIPVDPVQAEMDALRKENAELQMQLDEMKKQQAQPQSAPAAGAPAQPVVRKSQPPAVGGDVVLGTKDHKATAMSIKQAIEEMNAITDKDAKKAMPKSVGKKEQP